MIYVQDKQRVTVWSVEDKGNYSLIQMSSSRKDRRNDGAYINSSWGFVRFVSKAHEKAGELEKGDRILLKGAAFSREPYMKNDERVWPKNPTLVVFDFEYPDPNAYSNTGLDTPPAVEDNNEELPF